MAFKTDVHRLQRQLDMRWCADTANWAKFSVSPSVVLLIMGSWPDVSPPVVDNSPTWDSAVSSTLFACQWISNIVPVPVLPSSTYSSLARAISKMFLSVRQDVHPESQCWRATEHASPGVDDNICATVNSPVRHDAVPAQHKRFTLPSQSADGALS